MELNRTAIGFGKSVFAHACRRIGTASALTCGLFIAAGAAAAPITVTANEDDAQPGFFTLNFGAVGGATSGHISSTDYGLEVDPDAGTSRLTTYYQVVDPLTLPGGFDTGDLIIEVVEGSSTGTYDPQTHVFTTSEMYAIHFSGDLSAFGIESPFVLPSTSTGMVDLNAVRGGSHIDLQWEGVGELNNPFDPDNPLQFSYTCEVNTVFTASAGQLVTLGLTPSVQALGLPSTTESKLVAQLDFAAMRIAQGFTNSAIRHLMVFIADVDDLSGTLIPTLTADALTKDAQAVINKLRRANRFIMTR